MKGQCYCVSTKKTFEFITSEHKSIEIYFFLPSHIFSSPFPELHNINLGLHDIVILAMHGKLPLWEKIHLSYLNFNLQVISIKKK